MYLLIPSELVRKASFATSLRKAHKGRGAWICLPELKTLQLETYSYPVQVPHSIQRLKPKTKPKREDAQKIGREKQAKFVQYQMPPSISQVFS